MKRIRRLVDDGHEETEAVLKKIEKEISEQYRIAEKEIQEKLDDYLRRFEIKDELKRKGLANGLITKADYDRWRTGQIMIGQRWTEMRDTIAEDLTKADQIARSIAFGYTPEVYAINHNYGTFQVEHGSLIDTSYTLYDKQTVERLFMDDQGRFVPKPGRKLTAKINAGKAQRWNSKNVQSAMLQGIMQGESVGKIATRLANSVGEQNRKAAIRNARTMVTGVQNAGRLDSYERAKEMGINVGKQWMDCLDMRTRHWHAELDGVIKETDEPFENEYGEIMYPGDPEAEPGNIYNCRCTLIAAVKGYEHDLSDLAQRNDKLEDMTYDEWKEEHETYSDSITKQDEIENTMRGIYGAEYGRYASLPDDVVVMDLDKLSGGEEGGDSDVEITEKDLEFTDLVRYDEIPGEDEIIDFVKVEKDPTGGSCTSAAMAYVGNRFGYKMKDFKDDASRIYFAETGNIIKMAAQPGVKSKSVLAGDDFAAVRKLMKNTKKGKEYILSTGGHTAVVRKNLFGYEYLELQGVGENGWNKLTEQALEERFGCLDTHELYGVKVLANTTLIDVESLNGNSYFERMLGYVNSYEE